MEGQETEFKRIYGPNGDWAQLFRQGKGYLGTELLHDTDHSRHYITIDRWNSSAAFDSLQENYRAEYEAMDARCNSLIEFEARIGTGILNFST